jgi:hypothetical protein
MKDSKHPEIQPYLLKPSRTLMDKVKEEAHKNYRTMNGQICFILEQYFEKKGHEEHL